MGILPVGCLPLVGENKHLCTCHKCNKTVEVEDSFIELLMKADCPAYLCDDCVNVVVKKYIGEEAGLIRKLEVAHLN